MGTKVFNPAQTNVAGEVTIRGEMTVSSGTVTVTSDTARGVSGITESAAGNYTFALANNYVELLDASITAKGSTEIDYTTQIKTDSVSSGSAVLLTQTGGTATDLPNGTYKFALVLRTSGLAY